MQLRTILNTTFMLFLATNLIACGGGGGGGGSSAGSSSSTSGGGQGNPDPEISADDSPYGERNASLLIASISLSEAILQITSSSLYLIINDISQDKKDIGCDGGYANINHVDADGSIGLSVGDTVSIEYSQCTDLVEGNTANGSIEISFTETTINLNGEVSIKGSIVLGSNYGFIDPNSADLISITGVFDFEYVLDDASAESLVVYSGQGGYVVFSNSQLNERIEEFHISKYTFGPLVQMDEFSSEIEIDLSYDSGFYGTSIQCRDGKLQFRSFNSNDHVNSENYLCENSDGSVQFEESSEQEIILAVDANHDGEFTPLYYFYLSDITEGFFNSEPVFLFSDFVHDVHAEYLDLEIEDMIFDSAGNRALLVLGQNSPVNPNSLSAIDSGSVSAYKLVDLGFVPSLVKLSNDSSLVFIVHKQQPIISIYDSSTLELVSNIDIQTAESIYNIAISPSNSDIVAVIAESRFGENSSNANVYLVDNGVVTPGKYSFGMSVWDSSFLKQDIEFSPDGSLVYLSGTSDDKLMVFNYGNSGFEDSTIYAVGDGNITTASNELIVGESVLDISTFVRQRTFSTGRVVSFFDSTAGLVVFGSSRSIDVCNFNLSYCRNDVEIGFVGDANIKKLISTGERILISSQDSLAIVDINDLVMPEPILCEPIRLGGTVYFDCSINDFVFDPARNKVYAIVSNGFAANGSSIIAIDVDSITVDTYVQLSSVPNAIDISSDNNSVYVTYSGRNEISRFDIETWQEIEDIQVPLGFYVWPGDDYYYQNEPYDIYASPLNNDLVVVCVKEGSSSTSTLAFKQGVLVQGNYEDLCYNVSQNIKGKFDGMVYSWLIDSDISQYQITESNIEFVQNLYPDFNNIIDGLPVYSTDNIYLNNGRVIELATLGVFNAFNILELTNNWTSSGLPIPDPDHEIVYIATHTQTNFIVGRADYATGNFTGTEVIETASIGFSPRRYKHAKNIGDAYIALGFDTGLLAIIPKSSFD